jgi:hypothetical protein
MPSLKTEGGKPVAVDEDAVNAAFDAAMNADDSEVKDAPPKREEKPAGEAAPKPRRTRTPKAEKSRTTSKPAAPVKDSYAEELTTIVSTAWLVSASVPVTQPYALVLHSNSDALVAALDQAAKSNDTIRRYVAGGAQASWQLSLAGVVANMGMQAWSLYKNPEARALAAEATRGHLQEFVQQAQTAPAA